MELRQRTAVVTGAASGIGLALAVRFAREGMNVVLADVEVSALEAASAAVDRIGPAMAVPTDVADASSVLLLRDEAHARFGTVHVLCNNAGVLLPQRPAWQIDLADWHWVIDVNVWGVVHGIRTFVPAMVASGERCHVVNTSSNAGVVSVPGQAAYSASKHAVTTISETLALDLASANADVGVSVLCPGPVRTRIAASARNHPDPERVTGEVEALAQQGVTEALATSGDDPDDVAGAVVAAIRERRFYVFTRPSVRASIQDRSARMVEGRPPAPPPHLAEYGLAAPRAAGGP